MFGLLRKENKEYNPNATPKVECTDSTYNVPYTTIKNITPHNNADNLEVAWVYGFQVIVRKGQYKVGDAIVYCPIDSILTQKLEDKIFPPDSKIKLNNHRVRQIRIRGLASQGMIIDPIDIWGGGPDCDLETDLAGTLGITKYEPPAIGPAQTQGKDKQRNKRTDNPYFRKFNGVANIKWFPDLFTENDEVVVQEKIHGSHIRFAIAPFIPRTWFQKLRKWLGVLPQYENVYGSNNVEITSQGRYKGYYGDDIYGKLLKKYDVFNKIPPCLFFHAELYGGGVQKNYTYGCAPDEHKLIVFDIRVLEYEYDENFNRTNEVHKWLPPEEVSEICRLLKFDFVPVLYKGQFNREKIAALADGPSVLCPSQKVREGIVIKDAVNYDNAQNKKCLKLINEAYLDDKSNTDFQ